MNIHQSKINMLKFDDTNNFVRWRCEVMDALNAQNLEDILKLQQKPEDVQENDLKKMNQTICGVIRSYLTQDLKHHVMN